MTPHWIDEAIFYHIYPLGLCGAPARNPFQGSAVPRLNQLYSWLDHLQSLGVNALYLGPLFESSAHGYDTADYYQVDRRLGDRETLAALSREIHRRGMHLVLDGVFNHTGRDFWAFRDIKANGEHSAYTGWFQQLDFSGRSPYGDPFRYEGWSGHYDLVKLNLFHSDVRQHLFDAIGRWVEEFEIDGLRLDAADQLPGDFLEALAQHCRGLRPDFWLMGEIVFGDYRSLAGSNRLDSATNYEGYKSLYSSLANRNFFELAYALNRQSGPQGIYRDLRLYNFADNHDVNRVASNMKIAAHLYPLYALLFTMPGIPSIYYGSEWGLSGKRTPHSDASLRPSLDLTRANHFPHPDLAQAIARLAQVRRASPALRLGNYGQLHVAAEQLAFLREHLGEQVVVAVNAATHAVPLQLRLPIHEGWLVDRLNDHQRFQIVDYQVSIAALPSTWARILSVHKSGDPESPG
ncbi:MAG: alpha-amylase family glycosyl hydrolase [Anaerolineaceae bacterium]|nr:alpha-amylase family glycosyl hydrolase [Anaerolineaceae bacterium]